MTHDTAFLDGILPDDAVARSTASLDAHATDWGTESEDGVAPDVVVYPETTDAVSAVLSAADERGVPVTPYAAGTSLEGNPVPVEGGISMDLTRMDEVLAVRPGDFQVDVQPGVLGSVVDEAVGEYGLFFPPLPSSGDISTIGGMIANDASGMGTVKYGEVADWVLELEAVLADGSVVSPGSRAIKSSSGYNLKDLLVGSEGTLAVITRATLKLAGRPQQVRAGRALFPTLDDAVGAVTDAVQSGVDVAKIELLDRDSARMANAYSGTDLPDRPTVFVEFHADHGVAEEVEFCTTVFADHDAERFAVVDGDEMDDLWAAREELAVAIEAWDPDLRPLHPGDVTVPIGDLGAVVRRAKELAAERDQVVPCFGHAGDGNLHYTVLVDPDDDEAVARAEETYADIVALALERGGTATGEHGIGLGKREYLVAEHGEAGVAAMRSLKTALDPNDTLNPEKIFPGENADRPQ